MQTDSLALTAKIILFSLSASSLIVFWLSGMRKYYLLYLGFGFLSLGLSLFFKLPLFRMISLLLTLYIFIIAILEGISDTKERLTKFRKEVEEREAAFADFQKQLIENEKNKVKEAGENSSPTS